MHDGDTIVVYFSATTFVSVPITCDVCCLILPQCAVPEEQLISVPLFSICVVKPEPGCSRAI